MSWFGNSSKNKLDDESVKEIHDIQERAAVQQLLLKLSDIAFDQC